MKNLIYILIFIPSLLFSQETKNMELVGVRNISVDNSNPTIDFQVEEGIILKVLSFTHSQPPSSDPYVPWLKLNNEYVYYSSPNNIQEIKVNLPLFLSEGIHQLVINTHPNITNSSATLYGLEFKLTTP